MKRYEYIGTTHAALRGQTALGRIENRVFMVQVDGTLLRGDRTPSCVVCVAGRSQGDWAYGWHKQNKKDWRLLSDDTCLPAE